VFQKLERHAKTKVTWQKDWVEGLVEKAEFLQTEIQDHKVFHVAFPADLNEHTCWTSDLC